MLRCSRSMVFRSSSSSGFHQGLALAPGLLVGMLAVAALVMALVSSEAAKSKKSVIFRPRFFLKKSVSGIFLKKLLKSNSLFKSKLEQIVSGSSNRCKTLRIGLLALFAVNDVANRSQSARLVLYLACSVGFSTRLL